MNVQKMSSLCPIILSAIAAAQISVSVPADIEERDQVERVQVIPASQLDNKLPAVILSDWLLAEAGPDVKIGWSYSPPHMGLCWNNAADHCSCGFVDAHARTWDGREFFVQIATGGACSAPVFDTGMVSGREDLHHLSDLPSLLWGNPSKIRRTKATR